MVKLAAPKQSILDHIKIKQGKTVKKIPKETPAPDNKGVYNGRCNRSACLKPGANFYNWGSHAYYCASCARMLSVDPVNRMDALNTFGHELCTEGRRDDYLEATVGNALDYFLRLAIVYEEKPVTIASTLEGWIFHVTCLDTDPYFGHNKNIYRYREALATRSEVKDLFERFMKKHSDKLLINFEA